MDETLEKAVDFVCKEEGFNPTIYICPAGIKTIGYGRTYDIKDNETTTREKERVHVLKFCTNLKNKILSKNSNLTNNQLIACISFFYNLTGATKMWQRLEDNKLKEFSDKLLEYNKVKGVVVQGLKNRREREQQLFNREI